MSKIRTARCPIPTTNYRPVFATLVLAAAMIFSVSAGAQTFQSETQCSDHTQEVCAYILYEKEFNTTGVFDFEFQIEALNAQTVDAIGLYLWMPNSNFGIDPVIAKKVGPGRFRIESISFPILGKWEVRAEFDLRLFHQIIIPIEVK